VSAGEGSKISGLLVIYCSRLNVVARQLRDRHEGRSTLEIEDEYDVQDLLHSLLRLHFDDVRSEEWTPSYAGGSGRMDFLLKVEQIVIEAKMARPGRSYQESGGVEGDLRKLSDSRLQVIAIIAP
jgi:DpnII restriction endonuclease